MDYLIHHGTRAEQFAAWVATNERRRELEEKGNDREDKRQELAAVDRAVFVANMSGTEDKRKELTPPW